MVVKHMEEDTALKVVSDVIMRHDSSISLGAKWVYGQLCGLPDNWDCSIAGLAGTANVDRDTVAKYVRELEQHGYVYRKRKLDAYGRPIDTKGQFTTTVFAVYSDPKGILGPPTDELEPGDEIEGGVWFDTGGMYEKNFSFVSRAIDDEKGMTPKAKAMYHVLCSMKPWDKTTEKDIAKLCKEGEGVVSTALKQLEHHGYMKRDEVRDEKGNYVRTDYHIFEDPNGKFKTGFKKKSDCRRIHGTVMLYDSDYASLVRGYGEERVQEAIVSLNLIRIALKRPSVRSDFNALLEVLETPALDVASAERNALDKYMKTLSYDEFGLFGIARYVHYINSGFEEAK